MTDLELKGSRSRLAVALLTVSSERLFRWLNPAKRLGFLICQGWVRAYSCRMGTVSGSVSQHSVGNGRRCTERHTDGRQPISSIVITRLMM